MGVRQVNATVGELDATGVAGIAVFELEMGRCVQQVRLVLHAMSFVLRHW